jgi:hypothetical protein
MSSALFRQYINILIENDDPNQPESPSRRNFLKGLGAVAAAAAMPNTANTILKQDFDFANNIGLEILSQKDPLLLIAKINTPKQSEQILERYNAMWDTGRPSFTYGTTLYIRAGLYLIVTVDEDGKKLVYQTSPTLGQGLFDTTDKPIKPNELSRLRSFADFKDFERNVAHRRLDRPIEYSRSPDNILKTVGKSLKTASNVSQSANEISRLASLAGIAAPMNKQDDNNDNITAPPDAEFGDIDDNDQEELTALPPPSEPEFDFKTRIKTPVKEPIKR